MEGVQTGCISGAVPPRSVATSALGMPRVVAVVARTPEIGRVVEREVLERGGGQGHDGGMRDDVRSGNSRKPLHTWAGAQPIGLTRSLSFRWRRCCPGLCPGEIPLTRFVLLCKPAYGHERLRVGTITTLAWFRLSHIDGRGCG